MQQNLVKTATLAILLEPSRNKSRGSSFLLITKHCWKMLNAMLLSLLPYSTLSHVCPHFVE